MYDYEIWWSGASHFHTECWSTLNGAMIFVWRKHVANMHLTRHPGDRGFWRQGRFGGQHSEPLSTFFPGLCMEFKTKQTRIYYYLPNAFFLSYFEEHTMRAIKGGENIISCSFHNTSVTFPHSLYSKTETRQKAPKKGDFASWEVRTLASFDNSVFSFVLLKLKTTALDHSAKLALIFR